MSEIPYSQVWPQIAEVPCASHGRGAGAGRGAEPAPLHQDAHSLPNTLAPRCVRVDAGSVPSGNVALRTE